jgi:hypothetical protein
MVASSLRAYVFRVESPPFATVGLRAWWALCCLPRNAFGNLPQLRPLEREHDLSNGALRKLIWDNTNRDPGYSIAKRMAKALGCDPDWLFLGIGQHPRASWPVPPRPAKAESLSSDDAARAIEELEQGSDSLVRIVGD